jgi:hypothetical protein
VVARLPHFHRGPSCPFEQDRQTAKRRLNFLLLILIMILIF